MPKYKKRPMKPWLSGRVDGNDKRFLQVGNSFLLSKKVHKLTYGAIYTYLCMCLEAGGKEGFKFSRSAASKYGIPPTSFRRYVEELVRDGYIKRHSGKASLQCNQYEFSPGNWKN